MLFKHCTRRDLYLHRLWPTMVLLGTVPKIDRVTLQERSQCETTLIPCSFSLPVSACVTFSLSFVVTWSFHCHNCLCKTSPPCITNTSVMIWATVAQGGSLGLKNISINKSSSIFNLTSASIGFLGRCTTWNASLHLSFYMKYNVSEYLINNVEGVYLVLQDRFCLLLSQRSASGGEEENWGDFLCNECWGG